MMRRSFDFTRGRWRRGITQEGRQLTAVVSRDYYTIIMNNLYVKALGDVHSLRILISMATHTHRARSSDGSQANRPSHNRNASGILNSRVKSSLSHRLV